MTCLKCDQPRKFPHVLLCEFHVFEGDVRYGKACEYLIQWPGMRPCAWQGGASRKDRRQWLRDITKQMAKAAR